MILRTGELSLHRSSRRILEASCQGVDALSRALMAQVPKKWPPEDLVEIDEVFLDVMDLRGDEAAKWLGWYWVREEPKEGVACLVGLGGFKGAPSGDGMVEIGYNVLPRWQGMGIATRAVRCLRDWAISQPEVSRIRAHVHTGNVASVKVLERTGFQVCEGFYAEAREPEVALRRYMYEG